jgi:hypothetical protein
MAEPQKEPTYHCACCGAGLARAWRDQGVCPPCVEEYEAEVQHAIKSGVLRDPRLDIDAKGDCLRCGREWGSCACGVMGG